MSKNRADLKSALRSLDVSKSLRIPPQLGFAPPQPSSVPETAVAPRSSSLANSLSKLDGGNLDHSSIGTPSNPDSVQIGQNTHEIIYDSRLKKTVSKMDPVKNEQRHIATVSTAKSVTTPAPNKSDGRHAQRTPFTAVPNFLLREEGRFSDPLDFMIFLHLFTYSHGFGRDEASMSQAQLERFTGASKNTVKRSMYRLTKQGLVKCVEEYEHARMSRRFRVDLPSERGPGSGSRGKSTNVFKPDGVQNGEDPKLPVCLSNLDSATVSKADIYKESIPKKKSKNSLSPLSGKLREYFEGLRAFRKRDREWEAFQGLRSEFTEEHILECLEHLQSVGLPGSGQECHSPMAYLSHAISEVGTRVTERKAKIRESEDKRNRELDMMRMTQNMETKESEEFAAKQEAFLAEFRTAIDQQNAIEAFSRGMPFSQHGQAARVFAIQAWWNDRHCRDFQEQET